MNHWFQFAVLCIAGWLQRTQQDALRYVLEENRVLREHLGNKCPRLTLVQRARLARKAFPLSRQRLTQLCPIVTPDTLRRWYRKLVAQKYDGSARRSRSAVRGRPQVAGTLQKLIVQIATDNPTWGYTRIRGALANLGHSVARSTIQRVLKDNGLEPSPKRSVSWKTFLKAHASVIKATDFFSVEVLTPRGLIRHLVLFVIDLETRRVEIANISYNTCGETLAQVARNLTDPVDGFLHGARYLICDRDPLFTEQFARILRDAGVKLLKIPPSSPNCNAFAERFVQSIRRECLDLVIPSALAISNSSSVNTSPTTTPSAIIKASAMS